MVEPRLTQEQIQAAESVLRRGDRVELIPVKDGVRVMRVRRNEISKASRELPENS